MSFNYYTYGTCDICKKTIDSREYRNYGLNENGYDHLNIPVLNLYPSNSKFIKNKKYNILSIDICYDCATKIANTLYNSHNLYYDI